MDRTRATRSGARSGVLASRILGVLRLSVLRLGVLGLGVLRPGVLGLGVLRPGVLRPGILRLGVLGLSWIASGAGVGCSEDDGPRLDSAMPAAATRNAMVALTGRRLCGSSGDCARAAGEIQLGIDPPMVRAIVVAYSDTGAQIVIPEVAPVGATAVIVTVNERSSNALAFEVLP